jgi:ribosome-binding protein aMBF1 (putative translation factor)
MRICEICGEKDDTEIAVPEKNESVLLHVCENCREDRKWSHYENWEF